MTYVNAHNILPEELVVEIQKYVQGETLYIPKHEDTFKKWGEASGSRKRLYRRNEKIRESFTNGLTIDELAETNYLSVETIKKIVYSHN